MFNYTVSALTERIRDFFVPMGIRTQVTRFGCKNTVIARNTVLSVQDGLVIARMPKNTFWITESGLKGPFADEWSLEKEAAEDLWRFLFC